MNLARDLMRCGIFLNQTKVSRRAISRTWTPPLVYSSYCLELQSILLRSTSHCAFAPADAAIAAIRKCFFGNFFCDRGKVVSVQSKVNAVYVNRGAGSTTESLAFLSKPYIQQAAYRDTRQVSLVIRGLHFPTPELTSPVNAD